MARRRPASASSIAAPRWMMQALSHCRSSGWPGSSGSRCSGSGLPGVPCGGLMGGVEPLAWEPAGVPGLSGPRRARTKRSAAPLSLPPLAGERGRLQSRAMCQVPWQF